MEAIQYIYVLYCIYVSKIVKNLISTYLLLRPCCSACCHTWLHARPGHQARPRIQWQAIFSEKWPRGVRAAAAAPRFCLDADELRRRDEMLPGPARSHGAPYPSEDQVRYSTHRPLGKCLGGLEGCTRPLRREPSGGASLRVMGGADGCSIQDHPKIYQEDDEIHIRFSHLG